MASNGTVGDLFGESVAIHGPDVLVGATFSEVGVGHAYTFRLTDTTWVETTILTNNANDYFGYSVSQSGDYLVIGAPHANQYAGTARVFHRFDDSWTEQIEIVASDGTPQDQFGTCVGISGNQIVVGVPLNDQGGVDIGKIFVYSNQ